MNLPVAQAEANVDLASEPLTPEPLTDDQATPLMEAFSNFSELSERLTSAYGQLEGQVAQLNDELLRARAERQREARQREVLADRLEAILAVMPAAVVLVDRRDRIDRFNPTAEHLFNSLAWGRLWNEVLQETLDSELPGGDWLLVGERRVTATCQALRDGGKILVMVDITDQRDLEQRLQRQDRLTDMGEMAAQLAHQVRTPLASALLYGGQLGKPGLSDRQRAHFAAQLVDGLRHTEKLVSDMLAFSRGGNFLATRLGLGTVLQRALDTLQPRLQAGGHELDLEVDVDVDTILGNADALTGVLCNLIDNSLNHGGAGTRLWCRLERREQQLRLLLEDDGPGIPADVRERIFDPFFTTRERGTGLGLAVAQSVLLAHGGSIRVRKPRHGGAAFELCLPLQRDSQGDLS